MIRKALPRITKFNGDPKKWIRFRRDVDRYKTVGKYDDYEMGILLLQSLESLALSIVKESIGPMRCMFLKSKMKPLEGKVAYTVPLRQK